MTAPRLVRPSSDDLLIPDVDWRAILDRVDRLWVPEDNPHHSIIGLTGAGKSYLMRHGLLPLVQYDRVLILDVKGDDPTLKGLGKPVKQIPTFTRTARELLQEQRPMDNWYRLVISDHLPTAQAQVARALGQVWREKNWIVVVDELRALIDSPARSGLGFAGVWGKFMRLGRSKRICMINMTQEPSWVPSAFYTQPSFLWLGRIEDERAHKRIAEIGSSRALFPHLARTRKRSWLYTDDLEDDRFFGLTKVVAL